MSSSSKILTVNGKSLKLDSREDIEPWIKDVDPTIIEEVHFGGNTIGVEAAKALAEFLDKTTVLKVRIRFDQRSDIQSDHGNNFSALL